MTTYIVMFLLMLTTFSLSGCEQKPELDAPRMFFSKNKIGSSADYGIVKWNDPEDHVATVHGFMDDMRNCITMADALNKDACAETGGQSCLNPFSCQRLNH